MIHWLQSLSENGFDVFIVVYLAVLHLAYHYLMRWHIKAQTDKIENMQKIIILGGVCCDLLAGGESYWTI